MKVSKKLPVVCFLVLSILMMPCIIKAQGPPPPKTKGYSISIDSIDKLKISEQEIAGYLKTRPNFGDTTGRKAEIVKIIKDAKAGLYVGYYKTYDEALEDAEETFKIRNQIDKVLVVKHERKMYLQKKGKNIKVFNIALGPNPIGQKVYEGDGRTPEGIYKLDHQRYSTTMDHTFHISYPNAQDIARAKKKGLTAGSNIMVHGTSKRPKTKKDWTNGCIALANTDMDIFKKMIFEGTVIEIVK